MNKEEILEASKKENKKRDYFSMETERNGAVIASAAMVLLAFIYYTYDIVKNGESNPAFYSFIAIYNAVLYGYRAIKMEQRRKLSIITSAVWTLLTVLSILGYFNVI